MQPRALSFVHLCTSEKYVVHTSLLGASHALVESRGTWQSAHLKHVLWKRPWYAITFSASKTCDAFNKSCSAYPLPQDKAESD